MPPGLTMFPAEMALRPEVTPFLPGGDAPKPHQLFRNPQLAETWKRVLREAESKGSNREAQIEAARNAFYKGFVAEAIDAFVRKTEVMDQSGLRHRGVLTADDMANWQASYDAPQTYEYHNFRVNKIRPWGQGPVFLQTLALLKGFDLAAMGPTSAEFIHTVVESMKLAFADREAYYGDPDFVDVPIETLLSDAYNDERRKLIADTASLELRPGRVDGAYLLAQAREVCREDRRGNHEGVHGRPPTRPPFVSTRLDRMSAASMVMRSSTDREGPGASKWRFACRRRARSRARRSGCASVRTRSP